MSDIAHHDRRSMIDHRSIESRAMYGAFYALFLTRAAVKRLLSRRDAKTETIFAEARTAASVMVASCFTGL